MARTVNVLYWLALVAWISAIVAAAISAMNVFGTMPDMTLENARFAALPLAEHGRVTAGVVMAEIFATVDAIQVAAAPLLVLALLGQLFGMRHCIRRPANAIRTVAIVTAAGLLAFYALALAPELDLLLRAYWASIETGDLAAARETQEMFAGRHVLAERILQVNLLLLIMAVGASAVALAPPPASRAEPAS